MAVSDVAASETSDLRPYDSRIRRLLSAPMRRLHLAAAIAGRSPTAALAALHFSTWVRTYSVDVVTGRRLPFGIDAADAPGASSAMQGAYALLRRGS